ncbi:hypothetical protein [Leptospira sp. GIMC2001]|uniref:hypothetical protein n=1 Tax=Leptospira sp. GIMC2001 TaxID=1513297 RepID=UPI00234B7D23|nr:hypothetical protein [Leptospira sp. GIMC2001]WCL47750.1 hypothetical protein O4O04_00400 [Leptospira sp. GIMC2001]
MKIFKRIELFHFYVVHLIIVIVLGTTILEDIQAESLEPNDRNWKEEYQRLEQKNLETEEKNRLLTEELRDMKFDRNLLELEKSASDQSESVIQEKSTLFLDRLREERRDKLQLEKKQDWIRKSFYYPGVQRYENGEWEKGLLWSIGIFGMLAVNVLEYSNVYQAKRSLDNTHSWDLAGIEAKRARYDHAYERAGFFFFVTGLLYVLNIADASFLVTPKIPEPGSVRIEIDDGLFIDPRPLDSEESSLRTSKEHSIHWKVTRYF